MTTDGQDGMEYFSSSFIVTQKKRLIQRGFLGKIAQNEGKQDLFWLFESQ